MLRLLSDFYRLSSGRARLMGGGGRSRVSYESEVRFQRLIFREPLQISRLYLVTTCFSWDNAGKYSHVTGLICDRLHWLHVTQRIQFKLCLMMYKAMHGATDWPLHIYPSSAQVPVLKSMTEYQNIVNSKWWTAENRLLAISPRFIVRLTRNFV